MLVSSGPWASTTSRGWPEWNSATISEGLGRWLWGGRISGWRSGGFPDRDLLGQLRQHRLVRPGRLRRAGDRGGPAYAEMAPGGGPVARQRDRGRTRLSVLAAGDRADSAGTTSSRPLVGGPSRSCSARALALVGPLRACPSLRLAAVAPLGILGLRPLRGDGRGPDPRADLLRPTPDAPGLVPRPGPRWTVSSRLGAAFYSNLLTALDRRERASGEPYHGVMSWGAVGSRGRIRKWPAILGISAYYHDLGGPRWLVDGQIVAAAQEERFTRRKARRPDFPPRRPSPIALAEGRAHPRAELRFGSPFYDKSRC